MANLHRLSVQEALNASGPGGVWTVNSVGTAAVSGGTATNLDVSGASQIGIYAGAELYFSFSAEDNTAINTSSDLQLPGRALTFITVPQGLGDTVYFNYLATSAVATSTVRIVEI